jgi:hypothetical protein
MRDVQQILKEIEALPEEAQLRILSRLNEKMKNKERIQNSLDEIRGIGKGLWDLDAQEYINRMRADDRL